MTSKKPSSPKTPAPSKALIAIAAVAAVLLVALAALSCSPENPGIVEETTAIDNPNAVAPDAKTDAKTPIFVNVNEAYVGLELGNAYIVYMDQIIAPPSQSIKVSLKDGLKFKAVADTGYQVTGVTCTFNDRTWDVVPDDKGFYSVEDQQVTSALTVHVKTGKVEGTAGNSDNVVLKYGTVIK